MTQLGITATFGLISVVSLPRVFVFRLGADDPHPVPWIRVLLSCALGKAVYPHPEWAKAAELWRTLYPLRGLEAGRARDSSGSSRTRCRSWFGCW